MSLNFKKFFEVIIFILFILSILYTSSCKKTNTATVQPKVSDTSLNPSAVLLQSTSYGKEDYYQSFKADQLTHIQLQENTITSDGSGTVIEGSTITILDSGTYLVSGKLLNGSIRVDTASSGFVRIILNGVDITSTDVPPIEIVNAHKTIISVESNSENILSDTSVYNYDESSLNISPAVISCLGDLTINGTGKLTLSTGNNSGIISTGELKILNSVMNINSFKNGISAQKLLAIKDGNLTIVCKDTGIQTLGNPTSEEGTFIIEGGNISVTTDANALSSSASLSIYSGNFQLQSGVMNYSGTFDSNADSIPGSTGIQTALNLAISGGVFRINSEGHSLSSEGIIAISDGEYHFSTSQDGFFSEKAISVWGGLFEITKSNHGFSSPHMNFYDGQYSIQSTKEGILIAGGCESLTVSDSENLNSGYLQISGGRLLIESEKGGINANGNIIMTDGTLLVNSSPVSGQQAILHNGSFQMNGGILAASGSIQKSNADENSTQNLIHITFSSVQPANTILHLETSDKESILTYAPAKDYQCITVSTPDLINRTSVNLFTGGNASGTAEAGIYSSDKYSSGTQISECTISQVITNLDISEKN